MLEEVIGWSNLASAVATLGLLIVTTMYVFLTRRTVMEMRDARLAELQPILLIHFGYEIEDEAEKGSRTYPTATNVGRGTAIDVRFEWLIGTDHGSPPKPGLHLYGRSGEIYTISPGQDEHLSWYDSDIESVGRYLWLALHYEDAQRNGYHRVMCYALGGGERLISDALYRTLASDRPSFGYDLPLFPASGREQVFRVKLRSPERDLEGQITAEREYLRRQRQL